MSGALAEGYEHVVTTLTSAGIPAISDARRLTPGAALVEPPSIVGISGGTTELSIAISITVAPQDPNSTAKLLKLADDIIQLFPIRSGEPGILYTGNQDLPSYRLTASLTVQR